jgi:hypothetical protein
MVHRRRTQHNDQSNCDLNFSHYARPARGVVPMASFPRLDFVAPKYSMLRRERRFDDQITGTRTGNKLFVDGGHA